MAITLNGTTGIQTPDVDITAQGVRIQADFTDPTHASRVGFQSAITNGQTSVFAAPNGTSSSASFVAFNSSAVANCGYVQMYCDNDISRLTSGVIGSGTALPMSFWTGGTERMRILTDGRVTLGSSAQTTTVRQKISFTGGGTMFGLELRPDIDNTSAVVFKNSADALIGSISLTGSATSYNTTSDYRLKENQLPIKDAVEKLLNLKPCTYTWKTDGSQGEGFYAHELQKVVPLAVTGTKDGLNEDGTPNYQSVDLSKLVPLLTAALQEAWLEIKWLKSQISALKESK